MISGAINDGDVSLGSTAFSTVIRGLSRIFSTPHTSQHGCPDQSFRRMNEAGNAKRRLEMMLGDPDHRRFDLSPVIVKGASRRTNPAWRGHDELIASGLDPPCTARHLRLAGKGQDGGQI